MGKTLFYACNTHGQRHRWKFPQLSKSWGTEGTNCSTGVVYLVKASKTVNIKQS